MSTAAVLKNAHTESHKKPILHNKVFKNCESNLTVLLQDPNLQPIYNIFCAILAILAFHCIVYDYFVEGTILLGVETFRIGFAKLHIALLSWCCEFLIALLIYCGFRLWKKLKSKIVHSKIQCVVLNLLTFICYLSTQLLVGYIGCASCIRHQMPFPTAVALLLETTRLLMKMHAFVRTNVAKDVNIAKFKTDNDDDVIVVKSATFALPNFRQYLYFLFAPTIVYRDQYPRTPNIRWRFAGGRLLEVIAIAYLFCFLYERHFKVHFYTFGMTPFSAAVCIESLFTMIVPSTIVFISVFYLVLHSVQNCIGELLRFGDRSFYKNWWSCSSYDVYYRTWNCVVHDWLYEYIYKDCYKHIFNGSRTAATLTVFTISAIIHEVIMGFSLQLFFPAMYIFFGISGVALVFATRKFSTKRLGNIFLWFSLMFGINLVICLYCMEFFAKKNCPRLVYETVWDSVIPHIWTCYKKFK